MSLVSASLMPDYNAFVDCHLDSLFKSVVRKYTVPLALHAGLRIVLKMGWETRWTAWKASQHDVPSSSRDKDYYYTIKLFDLYEDHMLNNPYARKFVEEAVEAFHKKNNSDCFEHAIEKQKQEIVRRMVRRSITTAIFNNVDIASSPNPPPAVSAASTDHDKQLSIEAGREFDRKRAELSKQHKKERDDALL